MAAKIGSKHATSYDWFQAIQASKQDNYIPEENARTYLIHPDISSEAKVIRKDCYVKLSAEAKEIIDTIVDRPVSFVKFAWKYDASFATKEIKKPRRIRRQPTRFYPRQIPKQQGVKLEKRLTNLHIIKLFFKYKWRKDFQFIENVVQEIRSFVEVF